MSNPVWQPPNDANPNAVLQSARRDTREGSFDQALAKFLWYHKHALEFDEALSGVRLSFALGYWQRLADVFPPARAAFVQHRDDIESRLRAAPFDFDLFQEFAAFNERLAEGERTAEYFVLVAQQDPAQASQLYGVAEPALIAVNRLDICSSYLEPRKQVAAATRCYIRERQFEESRKDVASMESIIPKLARPGFMVEIGKLVAILVINGRHADAEIAREAALLVVDDADFRTVLERSRSGHVPQLGIDGVL